MNPGYQGYSRPAASGQYLDQPYYPPPSSQPGEPSGYGVPHNAGASAQYPQNASASAQYPQNAGAPAQYPQNAGASAQYPQNAGAPAQYPQNAGARYSGYPVHTPQPAAYQPAHGMQHGGHGVPGGQPMGAPGFFSNPLRMFSAAAQVGENMQAGQNYVQSKVSWFTGTLFQQHFQVDPVYVRKKLFLLLAPYARGYDYVRTPESVHGHVVILKAPRYDVFAPDLYIPCLSMFTYIVMVAATKFMNGQFTPDVIYNTFTWASAAWMLNFIVMWSLTKGMGLLQPPTTLDLCAYSGYAFVGYCLSTLMGWLMGRTFGWNFGWLYTSTCIAIFLIRTFKQALRVDCAHSDRRLGPSAMYPLLMLGGAQIAIAWLMGSKLHVQAAVAAAAPALRATTG